jgi:hypothetical protein
LTRFILKKKYIGEGDPNLAQVVSLCLALAEFGINEVIFKQLPDKFQKYFERKEVE